MCKGTLARNRNKSSFPSPCRLFPKEPWTFYKPSKGLVYCTLLTNLCSTHFTGVSNVRVRHSELNAFFMLISINFLIPLPVRGRGQGNMADLMFDFDTEFQSQCHILSTLIAFPRFLTDFLQMSMLRIVNISEIYVFGLVV